MADPWTFGGGLMLGLASSLHCVGMCGGIAMMLGRSGDHPVREMLSLNAGRIGAYVLFGSAAGGVGAMALGGLDGALAHRLLRWAAAMTLAWAGLSTLGLAPSPAIIGHAVRARVHIPVAVTGLAARTPDQLRGLAAGFGWGMMPCGMVYGALLYAAFAGSWAGGLLVMAGFGLGTLPALFGVHGGSLALAALSRRPGVRIAAGLAIVLIAGLSLLPPEASLLALCR